MQPRSVSIVIDNHDYARFLAQAIDSALAQSYPHVEVIVVDDASTDTSRQIIERYSDRIHAVLHAQNRGQGGAFNSGFRASSGDIVMFLDADDWLYPNAAERVAARWVPGESKTHFRLDIVDAQGNWLGMHPAREVPLDSGDVVPLLFEFGRYETVVTTGNAFAREVLERVMPVPEAEFFLAADGYLATVVPFHGPVVTIEERLGAYRVHGANAYATGTALDDAAAFCERIRKRLAHDLQKDRVLRAKAAERGIAFDKPPYRKDPLHIELRLASLRMDPHGHPFPEDRRTALAVRGVAASRRARLSRPRRLLTAAWFLMVGFLPRRSAVRAIRWKMMPGNRSAATATRLKWLRRLLG